MGQKITLNLDTGPNQERLGAIVQRKFTVYQFNVMGVSGKYPSPRVWQQPVRESSLKGLPLVFRRLGVYYDAKRTPKPKMRGLPNGRVNGLLLPVARLGGTV